MLRYLAFDHILFMTTLQGDGFTVYIIKSKRRKTMALKVTRDGVSARIPANLPFATAHAFIQQKTAWIQQKLAEQAQYPIKDKQFIDGENYSLLGKEYSLRLVDASAPPRIIKSATHIELHGRLAKISLTTTRSTLIHWYKQQADIYLNARTQWLTEVTGLYPAYISIKTYKARWGSCSSKGTIYFNWQLIQAPAEVIDYVIIHELCHIRHHNHSAQFWGLVAQFMPDYKKHQQWLQKQGDTLLF